MFWCVCAAERADVAAAGAGARGAGAHRVERDAGARRAALT